MSYDIDAEERREIWQWVRASVSASGVDAALDLGPLRVPNVELVERCAKACQLIDELTAQLKGQDQ